MDLSAHSLADLVVRLEPPIGKVSLVLDTDTFNEIDDQFALTYAVLSPERLEVEAIYAAPFHNERSSSPEDGMLKSYDEIVRVLERLGRQQEYPVFLGARTWLSDLGQPVSTPAVEDLIMRARQERSGPLYVVGIGASTNIATALLLAPDIASRIVVVWLGGNALFWPSAQEFNLQQDPAASRHLFDCGVPLVFVPCLGVTDHLITTQAELARFIKGRSPIGDYLYEIYSQTHPDHFAYSRVIWDIAPIAWLVNPQWVPSSLVHSPILTSELTYSHDPRRHLIRQANAVQRDAIFADLFRKLGARHVGASLVVASVALAGQRRWADCTTALDAIGTATRNTKNRIAARHRVLSLHADRASVKTRVPCVFLGGQNNGGIGLVSIR